jgi:hypothetical protein
MALVITVTKKKPMSSHGDKKKENTSEMDRPQFPLKDCFEKRSSKCPVYTGSPKQVFSCNQPARHSEIPATVVHGDLATA